MNILAILGVGVLQTVIGAFWYSPALFGKFWMTVTGFNKLTAKEQKEAAQAAGMSYIIQIILQLVINIALYKAILELENFKPLIISLLVWVGFLLPIVIQMELWGTTQNELKLKKIMIVAGQLLVSTLLAGYVFGLVV